MRPHGALGDLSGAACAVVFGVTAAWAFQVEQAVVVEPGLAALRAGGAAPDGFAGGIHLFETGGRFRGGLFLFGWMHSRGKSCLIRKFLWDDVICV